MDGTCDDPDYLWTNWLNTNSPVNSTGMVWNLGWINFLNRFKYYILNIKRNCLTVKVRFQTFVKGDWETLGNMVRMNVCANPSGIQVNFQDKKGINYKFPSFNPQAIGWDSGVPFTLSNFLEVILQPICFKRSQTSNWGLLL